MSMLSKDANHNVTMLREGHPVGGMLAPETGTGWHRLMPSGDDASLVPNNKWQLNIGTLRADILDITDWFLHIYNEGYFQRREIGGYDNGIVTFTRELSHTVGMATLSNTLEWVIYPQLVVPMGITYMPDASTSELRIGVTAENEAFSPTPKPFAVLKADQMLVMHTQRLANIFYANAQANDAIMWGEHYIA